MGEFRQVFCEPCHLDLIQRASSHFFRTQRKLLRNTSDPRIGVEYLAADAVDAGVPGCNFCLVMDIGL